MRHITSILLAPTILFVALACGVSGDPDKARDPSAIVQEALTATDQLDSYHLAVITPASPEDIRDEFRWEVEFAAPDSYRFLLFGAEGESREICESYTPPEGGTGQTCREVLTKITSRTVFESILVGDKAYSRQCEALDQNCDDWQEGPRPAVAIAGPSPSFLPQWPLVAMEMAWDLQTLGAEDMDGDSLLHLRGSVNQIRAVMENERRVFTATGVTSFGEECEQEAAVPVSGTPIQSEEVCRELTYEEALQNQEPTLSFYDQHPSTVDVWISRDDFLVHRIEIATPPHEDVNPPSEEISVLFEYSRFNEIVIEPPR
jgi:hypothetical protein